MGEFTDWDDTKEGRRGRYLRCRVIIDLTKPLRRGSMTLDNSGKPNKVFFKYERMQDFCYICGHLGHTIRDFGDKEYDEDGEEEI